MPMLPPKIESKDNTVIPSTSSTNLTECPSCTQHVISNTDQFCRHCGLRILMKCSKCNFTVRPADKFCANCGAKRWKFYELWRYGILHRSPVFVISVATAAAVGYFALCIYLRGRSR